MNHFSNINRSTADTLGRKLDELVAYLHEYDGIGPANFSEFARRVSEIDRDMRELRERLSAVLSGDSTGLVSHSDNQFL